MELEKERNRIASAIADLFSDLPEGAQATLKIRGGGYRDHLTMAGERPLFPGRLLAELGRSVNEKIAEIDPALTVEWTRAGFVVEREEAGDDD